MAGQLWPLRRQAATSHELLILPPFSLCGGQIFVQDVEYIIVKGHGLYGLYHLIWICPSCEYLGENIGTLLCLWLTIFSSFPVVLWPVGLFLAPPLCHQPSDPILASNGRWKGHKEQKCWKPKEDIQCWDCSGPGCPLQAAVWRGPWRRTGRDQTGQYHKVHEPRFAGWYWRPSCRSEVIAEGAGRTRCHLANDALEQYGRRNNLRISGIPESALAEGVNEDTTAAVVNLANTVLQLDRPLHPSDIEVSHRLRKLRNAKPSEPRPIIVRFRSKAERYRVISNRKNLKPYNESKDVKVFINEDLTSANAKLFSTARLLFRQKHFSQVWTYNGCIKFKDLQGTVKSINSIDDVKNCLSDVRIP